MYPIHVGVFDEHEIFRRGLMACLREDPKLTIVEDREDPALALALVSPSIARRGGFACPVLVCANVHAVDAPSPGATVLGVLPRATLTPDQLLGAVHAASAGLHVDLVAPSRTQPLSDRSRAVLQLLADGHDTRHIARQLACSERTVKQIVVEIRETLGARNRTQAVAEGIRLGVI